MGLIADFIPDLKPYEGLRELIHANPELSGKETQTALLVAKHLRDLGVFRVREKIGGTGIAAFFENGPGKSVLLRSELDALPIAEQTSLPFASKANQQDRHGKIKPVMHACGHDVHIVVLLAAAETLVKMKSLWSGTLILVFQPAEETGTGARSMVKDGLYTRIPVPDILFNQHVLNIKAGYIAMRSGQTLMAADYLKITFYGRGGHGARPDNAVDPIVMAASAILRLQTIVSREITPEHEMAVVTVVWIHAGEAENVIPDHAEIGISIRTVNENTRNKVLTALQRIVLAESHASGAPRDPEITQTAEFPLTVNSQAAVNILAPAFRKEFADRFDPCMPPVGASEDFSILARAINKPYVSWFYGATESELYDQAKKFGKLGDLPYNHSPLFSPAIRPTLETGVTGFCVAALTVFAYDGKIVDLSTAEM